VIRPPVTSCDRKRLGCKPDARKHISICRVARRRVKKRKDLKNPVASSLKLRNDPLKDRQSLAEFLVNLQTVGQTVGHGVVVYQLELSLTLIERQRRQICSDVVYRFIRPGRGKLFADELELSKRTRCLVLVAFNRVLEKILAASEESVFD